MSRNVPVGLALGYEFGDLELLRREWFQGSGLALSGGIPGGTKFSFGAQDPRGSAEDPEPVSGGAQMGACLRAVTLAAQPFAVEQFGAGAFEGGIAGAISSASVNAWPGGRFSSSASHRASTDLRAMVGSNCAVALIRASGAAAYSGG